MKRKPDENEDKTRGIPKTRTWAIFLELERGHTANQNCETPKSTLKRSTSVAGLKLKAAVEIRDTDSLKNHKRNPEVSTVSVGRATKINISAPNSMEQNLKPDLLKIVSEALSENGMLQSYTLAYYYPKLISKPF
ncbi:unnamed protein product [Ceratitis capitata]|uniref:(Mediterranean fruit fly) hypothetical protein n=1 Tax=Ceratitis capitata TaxID=7213 RepID=A0A811UI00_CERCA|nr:unnamed protein product [Ceratitis capitata]